MFGRELRDWILGLDPIAAVMFVRSLLTAEANRLQLPAGAVAMPGNIFATDGGVDARTAIPATATTLLPVGRMSWQVKVTPRTPDLKKELVKPGVARDLSAGAGYVLAWLHETTDQPADEKWLADAVTALYPDARAILFLCEDLERLSQVHPTVVEAHDGPTVLGMPVRLWAERFRLQDLPYQADDRRTQHLGTIRQFARSVTSTGAPHDVHLRIFGDSGVGKSRLVYEALAEGGVAEQAVVAFSPTDVDNARLRALSLSTDAHAIVVVDDCSEQVASRLENFALAAKGRLRLITIGDRLDRHAFGEPGSIEVLPLPEGMVAQLVQQVTGLRDEDAQLVAGLSEGFPKLAVELAQVVVGAGAAPTVIAMLRSRRVGELLRRMLPDPDLRHLLAHLALVERLGFKDELAIETQELCDAFGIAVAAFQVVVEQETGRFVGAIERYRRLTPRALAGWLFVDLVRQDPAAYASRLAQFSPRLYESFRDQVQLLGGDPAVDALLREVAALRASSFRSAAGLTLEGARLLNTLAFAAPEFGAELIGNMLSSSPAIELTDLQGSRRWELVWALQHLLWFSRTFDSAADSLFALAVSDADRFANNATGVLVGAFQLVLGGTEVPIEHRLDWLQQHGLVRGQEGARIAFAASTNVFEVMQSRTGGWRGALRQPVEWRPTSDDEVAQAQLRAWQIADTIVSEFPILESDLAELTATTLATPRSDAVFDAILSTVGRRTWPIGVRAQLISQLRFNAHNVPLPAHQKQKLIDLAESLIGASSREALDVVLHTPYWKLAEDHEMGVVPHRVVDAAVSLADDPEYAFRLAATAEDADALTLLHAYRELGLRDTTRVFDGLVRSPDFLHNARVGYLAGRGSLDPQWADAAVSAWLEHPDMARSIPQAVALLPPTGDRADLAIRAVLRSGVPRQSLGSLAIGAWTRTLPLAAMEALAEIYVDATEAIELRAIVWMLEAWLTLESNRPSAAVRDRALRISHNAAAATDPGLRYSLDQLIGRLQLEYTSRLGLGLALLAHWRPPHTSDLALWTDLVRENPETTLSALTEALCNQQLRDRLSVEGAHVLSAMTREVGAELVYSSVAQLSVDCQFSLLSHFDFTGDELDPVVLRMLEQHDSEEFRRRLEVCFAYPHRVVTGSYAAFVDQRLAILRGWVEGHPSALVRQWAQSLIPTFEQWVARERRSENEEQV